MFDKKTPLFYLILSVVLAVLIGGIIVYFKVFKKPQISPETNNLDEAIKSLTAPAGETPEIPEEIIKSLTAPAGETPEIPEEIIKSLTAPAK